MECLVSPILSRLHLTKGKAVATGVDPARLDVAEGNASCACGEQSHTETHFFRGIAIAVPAGLGLWFGLLKLAGALIHHI